MAGTVKDAVPLHYGKRLRQQVPPTWGNWIQNYCFTSQKTITFIIS